VSKPLYIFDLDGTLALIEHRIHYIRERKPRDWRAFFAACVDDAPNQPVIDTMRRLALTADVWVWSGRSDEALQPTLAWLAMHTHLLQSEAGIVLKMRREGDYTPDEELKASWLAGMNAIDRQRLVAVFDDRDRVVAMWRRHGVPCFQVAPGEF
jgi:trehalose-6-phosphatase